MLKFFSPAGVGQGECSNWVPGPAAGRVMGTVTGALAQRLTPGSGFGRGLGWPASGCFAGVAASRATAGVSARCFRSSARWWSAPCVRTAPFWYSPVTGERAAPDVGHAHADVHPARQVISFRKLSDRPAITKARSPCRVRAPSGAFRNSTRPVSSRVANTALLTWPWRSVSFETNEAQVLVKRGLGVVAQRAGWGRAWVVSLLNIDAGLFVWLRRDVCRVMRCQR